MNIFNEISVEIDRFYERNMRAPDFVLVGLREWTRLEQRAGACPLALQMTTPQTFFVWGYCGKIEVKRHPTYYSMIAPVLEEMP